MRFVLDASVALDLLDRLPIEVVPETRLPLATLDEDLRRAARTRTVGLVLG